MTVVECPHCAGTGVGKMFTVCCGMYDRNDDGSSSCCGDRDIDFDQCAVCRGDGKLEGEDCVHAI